ncbi:MAG: hypothetical protein RSE27_00465 [Ruthenibacterium sp.]
MNTLVTGDLTLLTRSLCTLLTRENHIIFYGNPPQSLPHSMDVRVYNFAQEDDALSLSNLFQTYSFERVIYISASLMHEPDWSQENNALHQLCQLCCAHQVKRSIYVTLDIARIDTQDINAADGYNALLRSDTERLCTYYQRLINLTVLRVPFLYDRAPFLYDKEQSIAPLQQILQIAHASKRLYFKGKETNVLAFLSMCDLVALIERMLDSSEGGIYTASPTQSYTLNTFSAALQMQKPDLTIAYQDNEVGIALPQICTQPSNGVRKDFGWFAKDDIMQDLPALYAAYQEKPVEKDHFSWKKIQAKILSIGNSTVKCGLAVTVLFALAELLISLTANVADLNFTDLRLVFVMIVASIYGLKAGVYGGILACVGLAIEKLRYGAAWYVLFYNMENWIPFVFYMMIGMCLGYVRDKNSSAIKNRDEKLKVTENKYLFIKSIYGDLLVAKAELKRQVLGSHESFGKIFDITRKIDKSMPEEVLAQTLAMMSETLENDSIAIYMLGKERQYARLVICSQKMRGTLAKSILLADYPVLMQEMQEDDVWCNRQALAHYPAYCANVYQEGLPAYLIFLYRANFEQMGTYYINQIKVLCGLAKSALLRALDDTRRREAECCISGTNIYYADCFLQLLTAKQKIEQSNIASFLLCRVIATDELPQEISYKLNAQMRINDISGMGKDGNIYIAFAQVDEKDRRVILNRFAGNNLLLVPAKYEDVVT